MFRFSALNKKNDAHEFEEIKLIVAKQIQKLMDENGFTQKELADKLDVNKSYISRALSGKANLTIETLVKIGSELGGVWHIGLTEKIENEYQNCQEVRVNTNCKEEKIGWAFHL